MPKSPKSETLAKTFADMGEKHGENLANFFGDFCPSISRKSVHKKFHEKSSTNSTSHETKFFHRETLGAWRHKALRDMKSIAAGPLLPSSFPSLCSIFVPYLRHRVNGVGRGGDQTVFNQILTRFHGMRLKSG